MLAAVDAGSNTLRLLIGSVVDGRVAPELYQRKICRLAGGFTEEEGLSPAARERALSAFMEFAATCRSNGVTAMRAVGTAAFRQAVNGAAFATQVRAATGLPLEVISGETEAACTAAGVLSALDPLPETALIVDVGGGSTEFILCAGCAALWSRSIPLGVVRLAEGHAQESSRRRAVGHALDSILEELRSACLGAGIDPGGLTPVGTAGTATSLAALDMAMTRYDWRRVNNYRLPRLRLEQWRDRLAPMTPAEREALPGLEPGRGDLITSGLEILLGLVERLGAESLIISDFGILEGLLLSLGDIECR